MVKFWRRILISLLLSFVVLVLLWLTKPFFFALSFLAGCFVYWAGEICFSLILLGRIGKKKPEGFLWFFSFAEVVKLIVFAVLFVLLVEKLRLHIFPMFAGFLMNLLLFWLLSIRALGDT